MSWLDASPEKTHPILMGATTYRLMAGFHAHGEDFSDVLTAAPKWVFSSTLDRADWENTTLVRTDAVEAVRRLKAESSVPLRTLGSVSLCRSLLAAGLVDRFRTVVFPVINGATGEDRIFDGYPDVRLELVHSALFDGRLQLLEYEPTVLSVPPLEH